MAINSTASSWPQGGSGSGGLQGARAVWRHLAAALYPGMRLSAHGLHHRSGALISLDVKWEPVCSIYSISNDVINQMRYGNRCLWIFLCRWSFSWIRINSVETITSVFLHIPFVFATYYLTDMIMSWYGNGFHITAPFVKEFHNTLVDSPHRGPSDAELFCFLCC